MKVVKNKIQIDELKKMAEKIDYRTPSHAKKGEARDEAKPQRTEKFKKRWQKLSFFEQRAHIGSEIQRAINWREKNPEYSKLAFERALYLLDLTISDKKNQSRGRLKELLRTREFLVDYFYYENIYKTNDKIWQNYFLAFNWAINK